MDCISCRVCKAVPHTYAMLSSSIWANQAFKLWKFCLNCVKSAVQIPFFWECEEDSHNFVHAGTTLILQQVTSSKICLSRLFLESRLWEIAIKWLFYQISLESATKWVIRWAILYRVEVWCAKRASSTRKAQSTKHKAQSAKRASSTSRDFRVTRIMGRFPDLESPWLGMRLTLDLGNPSRPRDSLIQSSFKFFVTFKSASKENVNGVSPMWSNWIVWSKKKPKVTRKKSEHDCV